MIKSLSLVNIEGIHSKCEFVWYVICVIAIIGNESIS